MGISKKLCPSLPFFIHKLVTHWLLISGPIKPQRNIGIEMLKFRQKTRSNIHSILLFPHFHMCNQKFDIKNTLFAMSSYKLYHIFIYISIFKKNVVEWRKNNCFKWDEKVAKIWHLIFRSIWKYNYSLH